MSAIAKVMAGVSASITDLKSNPNTVMKESEGEAVAILKSNAPFFFAVPPKLF